MLDQMRPMRAEFEAFFGEVLRVFVAGLASVLKDFPRHGATAQRKSSG